MLLNQVCDFKNLVTAFHECSRGKRSKYGYQNFIFNYGEKLKSIEQELKATQNFKWGLYRSFYVHDPKKRLVMAAPFRDRIVHTAIHKITEPLVDRFLGCRTYACRYSMGNRNAVLRLDEQVKRMESYYCVKLDIRKYFASINHEVLFQNITKCFNGDESLNKLLWSLIQSFPEFTARGHGIPIGNLTSQLFANFYLSGVDRLACDELNLNFYEDEKEDHAFYMRYMDDMIIMHKEKKVALEVATKLVTHAKENFFLNIPTNKYVVLGLVPIPFLGFLVSKDSVVPLKRNERKFMKKLKRLKNKGYSLSYRAQVMQSYEAWQLL